MLGWPGRIIVFASGSRGDVQPLVALALGLQRAGHDVTVAAPGDFAGFVEGRGLPFHGFSAETREILSSDLGRLAGHSSHRAMLELKLLTQMMKTVGLSMVDEVLPMVGAADVFVSGLLTVDGTDAIVRAGGGGTCWPCSRRSPRAEPDGPACSRRSRAR